MNLQLIKSELESLESRWYKLLIVSGNNIRKDKEMAHELNISFINLNLKISEKLIEVSKSKYALLIPEILQSILEEQESNTYWLGDIEILFDKQLKQNPVRLLENIGKRYKLIVSWPGEYKGNQLSYANPDHPEYFICHETDGKILTL